MSRLAYAAAIRLKYSYSHPNRLHRNEQIRYKEFKNKVFISVSGSNDIWDWLQNIDTERCPVSQDLKHMKEYEGILVSRGYVQSVPNVLKAIGSVPDKGLWIEGHSAGGAKAILTALDLHARGFTIVKVHTFNSPAITREHFNLPFECDQYRVRGDVVSHLPSSDWPRLGNVIDIGEEPKDHFGVIRDLVQAYELHKIDTCVSIMEKLCTAV